MQTDHSTPARKQRTGTDARTPVRRKMLLIQLAPEEHAALSAVAERRQTSLRALVMGALHGAGLLDEPQPSTDERRHLTSAEVAAMLGVGVQRVAMLARQGRLTATRSGRRRGWLFDREEVLAYMCSRSGRPRRRRPDLATCPCPPVGSLPAPHVPAASDRRGAWGPGEGAAQRAG